jgi:hypothetical protein
VVTEVVGVGVGVGVAVGATVAVGAAVGATVGVTVAVGDTVAIGATVAVTSTLGVGLSRKGSAVTSGSVELSAKSTTALQTIAAARIKTIINKTTLIFPLAISISPLLCFPDLYYTFK